MASRNAGGGSQGLGRQSSVATPSGSVMKSRQLVSFVFETSVFFFFFSLLFPLVVLSCFCPFWSLSCYNSINQCIQTHLHSQLALLSKNLSDTENLLRMTSVQAEAMKGLGSWHGGL